MDFTYQKYLRQWKYSNYVMMPAPKIGTKGTCTGTTKIDYCTEHASIKCSQSSHFLKLQVLPIGVRPQYGEGPLRHRGALVTDCIPEINYPVYTAPWNLCFSLLNPLVLAETTAKFVATGTWSIVPMPCCLSHLPVGIWKKSVGEHKYSYVPHTGIARGLSFRNLSLFFNSDPKVDALTKNCTLSCAWMGTISIVSSGRDEKNPAPYDPITGLIGPSAFDCLRNACGMIMNYTGLGATAAIAALDSIAAGLQEGFENGFEAGLKTGLATALGYGAGFAIGGLAVKGGSKLAGSKFGQAGINLGKSISAKLSPQAQNIVVRSLGKLKFKIKKMATKDVERWRTRANTPGGAIDEFDLFRNRVPPKTPAPPKSEIASLDDAKGPISDLDAFWKTAKKKNPDDRTWIPLDRLNASKNNPIKKNQPAEISGGTRIASIHDYNTDGKFPNTPIDRPKPVINDKENQSGKETLERLMNPSNPPKTYDVKDHPMPDIYKPVDLNASKAAKRSAPEPYKPKENVFSSFAKSVDTANSYQVSNVIDKTSGMTTGHSYTEGTDAFADKVVKNTVGEDKEEKQPDTVSCEDDNSATDDSVFNNYNKLID